MSIAPIEEPTSPVSPGDLLAGKYRVERVLGVGGMAFVVAARHEELGQLVAIKLLRPDLAEHDVAAARFLREARAAARIQSDHVARVFDVGMTESGHPFMVMEHLQGADLDETLLAKGALPITDAVDHVLEALEAVAHAHAFGIVHRDLKPANMFLASRPDGSQHIKVLDFGISKTSGASSLAAGMVTSPNALLGSPAYMSPEQARSSATVDLRTDLWSLGVILYELIAGSHPFRGNTVPKMLASIANDTPNPLRSVRPDVPEALEQIILRCLERDLDARFQNASELAYALAPFGSDRTRGIASRIKLVLRPPSSPPPSSRGASQPSAPAPNAPRAAGPSAPKTIASENADALEGVNKAARADPSKSRSKARSAAKGKIIALWLAAATALSIGMIGAAAWKASRRLVTDGARDAPPSAASAADASVTTPASSAGEKQSAPGPSFTTPVEPAASTALPALASASAPGKASARPIVPLATQSRPLPKPKPPVDPFVERN